MQNKWFIYTPVLCLIKTNYGGNTSPLIISINSARNTGDKGDKYNAYKDVKPLKNKSISAYLEGERKYIFAYLESERKCIFAYLEGERVRSDENLLVALRPY